jgi:hypothetical protein
MTLFKPAEVTSAFLKMGFMGFAGSGKTYNGVKYRRRPHPPHARTQPAGG